MKTIGDLIRARREGKEMTRSQLARRLNLTAGYLGHLENDSHVHLSERVKLRLLAVLGLRLPVRAVERHNDKATRWYRDYRAKQAKSKKRAA